MKSLFILQMLLLLLFQANEGEAAGRWQFEIEDRLENTVKTAWVTNEDGFRFSLARINDGRVAATFQLPEGTDTFLGTAPPVYQVDDHEERPLATWGIYVDMGSKQASWFIWDGTGDPCQPEPPAVERKRALCELMKGDELLFEYYRITGIPARTNFSLAGSEKAISALLE